MTRPLGNRTNTAMAGRILIIKHGAFGDLVQGLDACQAIRQAHADAEILLMTSPAHAAFARAMPWVDRVWLDDRPSALRPLGWWAIRRRLVKEGFDRVYDLQCSPRTARYFRLMPRSRRPQWVGAARGCSHPNPDFSGRALSNRQKMAAQLATAGIAEPAAADLSWLSAQVTQFALPHRFALLIPGCSPHLPHKRWPADHYGRLARSLDERGLPCVVTGTGVDQDAADQLCRMAPGALNLCGRTDLFELAAVARGAAFAVGNDTGATFLASAVGTPTLMLMSHHTDPAVSAPWGPGARWLKRTHLADLPVQAVEDDLRALEPLTGPAWPA